MIVTLKNLTINIEEELLYKLYRFILVFTYLVENNDMDKDKSYRSGLYYDCDDQTDVYGVWE